MSNGTRDVLIGHYYSRDSSRDLARSGLDGRLQSNDCELMKKCFRIDEVSAGIVKGAKHELAQVTCHKAYLEAASEKDMSISLIEMFNVISKAVPQEFRLFDRVTKNLHKRFMATDFEYPTRYAPGLVVFDRDPEDGPPAWKNAAATMEVQYNWVDGPSTDDNAKPRKIHEQVGDGCRLRMLCRQEHIFSLSLIISRGKFWGLLFDRDGVTVSPAYDIADTNGDGMDVFIRTLIQLQYRLTEVQLGLDPSVMVTNPSSPSTPTLCSDIGAVFSVEIGDEVWCLGKNLFRSAGLFGCGTSVYLAKLENPTTDRHGETRVLKSTWRASSRPAEGSVFETFLGNLDTDCWPTGLGRILSSGDATAQNPETRTKDIISISYIRRGLASAQSVKTNRILNRLVVREVGKPMWQYSSDVELLLGFRDCLRGLEKLFELGLVHRDVSMGNLLLASSDDTPDASRGFIADYEYLMKVNYRREGEAPSSGTAQYMALSLLQYLRALQDGLRTVKPVEHAPHHDLESAIYVYVHAIIKHEIKRLCKEMDTTKKQDSPDACKLSLLENTHGIIRDFAAATFAAYDLSALITSRAALCHLAITLIERLYPSELGPIPPHFQLMGALLEGVRIQNISMRRVCYSTRITGPRALEQNMLDVVSIIRMVEGAIEECRALSASDSG